MKLQKAIKRIETEYKRTETKSSIFNIVIYACIHARSLQSCLTLCNPMDRSPLGFFVHGILQARIVEWFPCLPPGDLPNPGIELASPAAPTLQVDFLPLSHQGSSVLIYRYIDMYIMAKLYLFLGSKVFNI